MCSPPPPRPDQVLGADGVPGAGRDGHAEGAAGGPQRGGPAGGALRLPAGGDGPDDGGGGEGPPLPFGERAPATSPCRSEVTPQRDAGKGGRGSEKKFLHLNLKF